MARFIGAPSVAEEPGPSPDGFEELERSIAADSASRADSGATVAHGGGGFAGTGIHPELTFIADFALAAFSEAENYQTGGHDPVRRGFNLQQLELSFGAAVDPYLRLDGNLVFSLYGVELEEAYATTLELPYRLQARFGQLLTRFGRVNATHLHSWDFVDQPLAIGRVFGGEGNRGLGVELSWLAPLPWSVELVVSATQAEGEATARSFFGAEDLGVRGPEDLLYVGAIKQFFPLSETWSLLAGLSGAFGPNSSGRSNRTDVYGADLHLKYAPLGRGNAGRLALTSEVLYRRRQVPEDVLSDFTGYAQAVYWFAQRFSVGARYEVGTAARGRDGDRASDPLDPEWTDTRSRVAANVTHHPTEFSKLRLQGSRDSGFAKPVLAAFLAAEVLIGAHGAHAF